MPYYQTSISEYEKSIRDKYNIEPRRAVEVGYFEMDHMATTRELIRTRGQLSILCPEFDAQDFNSFLVLYEDGIISECWGCETTIIWPDSFVFQLI